MRVDQEEILSRLLSGRDKLSRPAKEAILDGILDGVAPLAAPRPTSWWGVMLAVGAALSLLVLIGPSLRPDPRDDAFTARGTTSGPVLTVLCGADRRPGACPAGSELLFELSDVARYDHVAMFAFREDGVVIWYAPGADDASTQRTPAGATTLLPFRAHLGPQHPPGTYEVVAVLAAQPLTRAAAQQIYEATEKGSAPPRTSLVRRQVVVR